MRIRHFGRSRAGRAVLTSVISLVVAAPLTAAANPPGKLFEARDLFSLQSAGDPQISPDGKTIAYVRNRADIMSDRVRPAIWLIDVASGKQTPLATGVGDSSSPVWSPDGKKIAYMFSAPDERPQLYVASLNGGGLVRLTDQSDAPHGVAWSPDGKMLAFARLVPNAPRPYGVAPQKPEGASWAPPLEFIETMPWQSDEKGALKPGFSQVFIVASEGGASIQLTSDDFNNGDTDKLVWSPDGHTILFNGKRKPGWEAAIYESDIYALDVSSRAITPLTDREGPDSGAAFSPDGKMIAYFGNPEGSSFENAMLYVMNRDGSGKRVLTDKLDVSIERAVWAPDGKSILVSYTKDATGRVGRIGLDGRHFELLSNLAGGNGTTEPVAGGSFSEAKNGAIAFTSGDTTRPADISIMENGRVRKLTGLNDDWLSAKALGAVRDLKVKAPDGQTVPAWIVLPPNYEIGKRYPTILYMHGGPHGAYGPEFSSQMQLLAAAGYVVLYTDPRGSTSFGIKWAHGVKYDWPGPDYDDLMAAVDATIAQGIADPDNLFVTGTSAGGILTAWVIGKTNRFKAAVAQKGVYDWTSEAVLLDDWTMVTRYYYNHKAPWDDHEYYWKHSSLSLIKNVKTPTMITVGSEDRRTPLSQAQMYYQALKMQGVPTVLVKLPGASHHTYDSRPSQLAARVSAMISWFNKYRINR